MSDRAAATTGTDGDEAPAERSAAPWRPAVGTAWQWQLSGDLDLSVDVPVFDVDWQTTSADQVAALQQDGRRVICYVSAGTWESYRPDADQFPEEILGRELDDWPDERWLDIRRLDVLGPVLEARLDQCADKGFDAVEPDNMDGYSNDSGFPLTAEDQLTFNRWLAAAAHERGLGVGLKNDLDQVPDLVADFDFAVNESCLLYDECDVLQPFLDAGKAVLHTEYGMSPEAFCAAEVPVGFSSILKRRDLDSYRFACPDEGHDQQ